MIKDLNKKTVKTVELSETTTNIGGHHNVRISRMLAQSEKDIFLKQNEF